MSSTLPDLLDAWRAVDSRSVFVGRLPLSSLPRLRVLLLDSAGDVAFRLAFSRDEEQRAVVHGKVTANLSLRCQRCLKALDHRVDGDIVLAVVSGVEEARELSEQYDPLLVSERLIRPRDLVEDELLLGLPQVPMHNPDVCGAGVRELAEDKAPTKRANPFALLAELKHKQ